MTATEEERTKVLQTAYAKATTKLREEYRDRFNELRSQYAAEQGVQWQPKPTAEQQAEREFRALLEQYPHLVEMVQSAWTADVAPTQ